MGITLGCRVKQKLQKCPYQEIKKVEATIERSKCTLHFMEEKIKQLEKLLKNGETQALYELEQIYYDGFVWKEASHLEVPSMMSQLQDVEADELIKVRCPYVPETCEDVLALKLSRSLFFRKKMTQITRYYNELLSLSKAMLHYHHQYAIEKENAWIYFEPCNRPCLIYFNLELFEPMVQNHHLLSLFYWDETTHEVTYDLIDCYYNPASTLLQGTGLAISQDTTKLLQLSLPEELNPMFERQIIYGVERLINVLNKKYGKRYGKLKGCYLLLPQYSKAKQMELIRALVPLGYKVLGRVTPEGNFLERQMLIHLIHALE